MADQTHKVQPPAGWYEGVGDPAGSERFWDGESWQGRPRMKAAAAAHIEPPAPQPATTEQTVTPGPIPAAGTAALADESTQLAYRPVPMAKKLRSHATALAIAQGALTFLTVALFSGVRSSIVSNPYARNPSLVAIDIYAQQHAPAFLRSVTVITVLLGLIVLAQLFMARSRNVFGLLVTASIISALDVLIVLSVVKQASFGVIGLLHLVVALVFVGMQIKIALWALAIHRSQPILTSRVNGAVPAPDENLAVSDLANNL